VILVSRIGDIEVPLSHSPNVVERPVPFYDEDIAPLKQASITILRE
jgi:hypothetical protein